MEIRPILSTLRRHKITAFLVVLEIALTCAIVCNAVFLVSLRMQRMDMPSGVAEDELVVIQMSGSAGGNINESKAQVQTDLAALRQIPGVEAATSVTQMPLGGSSWNASIQLDPTQTESTLVTTTYYGKNLIETFGLRLLKGRDFNAAEYVDLTDVLAGKTSYPSVTLITAALAERLWPDEDALGKSIYMGPSRPMRVIGIVAALVRPQLDRRDDGAQWSILLPARGGWTYVLRTQPAQRQQVLKAAVAKLKSIGPTRVVLQKDTFEEIRNEFFQGDRAMAGLLLGVIAALLLVTAMGIIGLGSFWVAQRRRSIGVRRALGASRSNILHYFQTENFLLASIGIVLGMVLAYGINLLLMQHYELPRLPWVYLPVGATTLWLLGQLAVLGPALRAANVPPVVATRSV